MTKIIVFTDIHIEANPRPGKINAEERLRAGIARVMRDQADADRVIITGDLTHHGDVESYERLKTILPALSLPTHLMLGNHDNRDNFLSVFPDAPTDLTGHVQQVIDLPDRRLILLDTLFGPPYDYPASHAGNLCEARLGWLERVSAESTKPCIIFMHHVPHDIGFPAMDSIKLRESVAFYELIERSGNVEHIVCGHVHRTISGTHRGVPFSVFKSPVGQMPLDFKTMDTSSEVDEPPAYGILLLESDGLIVHTEDFA